MDNSSFAPGKSLTIAGGTLGVQGSLSVDTLAVNGGTLNFTNAALALANPLNNAGTINVLAGNLSMNTGGSHSGAFNVATGATLDFAGGTQQFGDGASLDGPGSITRSGGTLQLTGTGAGTTFGTAAAVDLNVLALTGTGKLTNAGTITGNAVTLNGYLTNTGTANFTNSTLAAGFINTGTMNLLGNLIAGGASATQAGGSINLNSNATLTKDTGTLFWEGGAFGGNGTLAFTSGGVFAFSGAGNRVIDSPNLIFSFNDFTLPDGSITVKSGHLTLGGVSTIPTGVALNVEGGTLTNNGQLNVAGNFALNSGSFDGAGGIDMQGGVLSKPASSTVAWSNTGPMNNTGTLDFGGGTITNAITNSAGTINVGTGVVFQQLFTNSGGTLNVLPGTTTFSAGYVQNGGILKGSGTVLGSVTINGGQLNVGNSPGALNITGNLILTPSSVTNIELGGTAPGTGFDVINVTGNATLAGTLNVISYGGYTPAAGNNFSFMNFGSSSGSFASTNLPGSWNIGLNSYSTYLDLLMSGVFASPLTPLQALQQSFFIQPDIGTTSGFNRVVANDSNTSLGQLVARITQVDPNNPDEVEFKQCQ